MKDLEVLILLLMFISGFVLLIRIMVQNNQADKSLGKQNHFSKKQKKSNKQDDDIHVIESFDYMGIKIINNNGTYSIIDGDKTLKYSNYLSMPYKYQKMLLEMDKQRNSGNKNSYILETINGILYVHFPDGRKKKYKNYKDIPRNIRNIMENR